MKHYCIACQGSAKQKDSVRFDGPLPDLFDPKASEKRLLSRRLLTQGEIPSEGNRRPSADELLAVMNWIEDSPVRTRVITRGGIGRRVPAHATAEHLLQKTDHLF